MKALRKLVMALLMAAIFCPLLPAQSKSIHWPQFRGPLGSGHAVDASDLPSQFDDGKNLVWKTDLPGRAWSSPVFVDDQIWLTTAVEHKATPEKLEAMKRDNNNRQGLSAFSSVDLKALRLDRETGRVVAEVDLFTVENPPVIHSLNSFASPTPVVDDKHVYFHFGTFGTAAVERKSNAVVWQTQNYPLEHEAGPGSSPVLNNGLLIVNCDGCDQQFVVALDAETGEQVWKTERTGKLNPSPMMKKAFCTPIIAQRNGRDELISPGANWVYAYEPDTGEELWKVSYGQLGFSNVAQPVTDGETLFVCTCFGKSKIMAIDFSGESPITEDNIKWDYRKQVPNMPSPIVIDGAVYFVNDRGIMTCLDAETGTRYWQSRLRGGFSSSPLLADGKIYVGNHDGEMFVIEPNKKELVILAENTLDSQIMASPVAFGQTLYVRTADSLYRFENAQ